VLKKRTKFSLVPLGAALVVAITASPSQAAVQHYASCYTTGSSGSAATTGWDYTDAGIPKVVLKVYDEAADGHHVRVRLVASYADSKQYFQWRANYDGYGTYKSWETYVSGSGNIFDVAVQVATYEGNEQLSSCTKWVSGGTKG